MSFDEAFSSVHSKPRPDKVSCFSKDGARMRYTIDGSSIVPDWDLVCENSVWRTTVQVAVSFGKFVGASSFGILSDKYGRKTSFTLGVTCYTLGSLLTSFSPWYWPFLVGRVLLGVASSGIFYPALTIRKCSDLVYCYMFHLTLFHLFSCRLPRFLVTENIGLVHRSWMSIAFTVSYPVGMMLLALSAHFNHTWRELQLSLTVPVVFLVIICWFV